MFDMVQKQCNEFIHGLTTILTMALWDTNSMPTTTQKQLVQKLSLEENNNNDVLLHDGTEREIPRPKDEEGQKENYSGKKKKHTLKNAVISTTVCVLFYL